MDGRRTGVAAEHGESQRTGGVGHDGVGDRHDDGRDLDDGRVGRGDQHQVDAVRRSAHVVAPTEELDHVPAHPGERPGERASGPTGTDHPEAGRVGHNGPSLVTCPSARS
jgi:hypothetical protein